MELSPVSAGLFSRQFPDGLSNETTRGRVDPVNESPGRPETGGFFCSVKQFTLKLRSEVLSGIRSLHGPLLRATGETAPLRWGFSLLPPASSSRTWGRPLVSTDSPGRDGAGADHRPAFRNGRPARLAVSTERN
jgi:hypothetical protein